jgi:hypothetical protein
MLGFSNDVGTVGRLILAKRLDIDIADAYATTMDRIQEGLLQVIAQDGS